MKPEPNSSDNSQAESLRVREPSAVCPAPLDLSPVAIEDELPDHAEPSIEQQLHHAQLLLQLDPLTPAVRLAKRRAWMNPERFTI